jgi:hypothetical protein
VWSLERGKMETRNYKEIFLKNKDNLFEKIFGNITDLEGNKYSNVYTYEIEEMSDDFSNFIDTLNKYYLKINLESIFTWLVFELDQIFRELDVHGCYLMAYELLKELE